MSDTWQPSLHMEIVAALVLIAVGLLARWIPRRWAQFVAHASWETGLVLLLLGLWELVGDMARTRVTGGMAHGYNVWHIERAMHLPNEVTLQHVFLPHHHIVQFANLFYATVHLNSMWVFLVWLWLRHRDKYPFWRNVVVFSTAFCLLVQMIPVAPPRFLDGIGIVDTPMQYHESVYAQFGRTVAQQLSAMPSVHVAWCVLIACAVISVSPSRWRWLILVHPMLTVWAVVVTGNHYWLDGIVAAALVVFAMYVERGRRYATDAALVWVTQRTRGEQPASLGSLT